VLALPGVVYSLNVPVPARVATLAADCARELPNSRARPRDEHTLGVKRLGDGPYAPIEARVRELLADQQPFELRVVELRQFRDPPIGSAPVVYLAVESDGLRRTHERLLESFPPAEGIEDNGYDPHVTVARGGSPEAAERLLEREIEPISWTASELCFWDASTREPVSTLSLS
jgi:2'-5' RNA ligase